MKQDNTGIFVALACVLLFLCNSSMSAQTSGFVLSGTVRTEENAVYATVTAAGDSALTYRTVTEENGSFRINNVKEGRYTITVTCLGYQSLSKTARVEADTDIGIISIKPDSRMLDEVTVMADFTRTKPTGETVIQVKGNPLAKGKSTVNFLRHVRDLDVTDRSISVHGMENTLIYLEDRRITFEQLRTIQPDMISRIEIIPHADPSYGVNASGGVVKVFLREDGGMLGTVSLYGQTDEGGLVQASPDVNVLYNRGKLSINNNLHLSPYGRYKMKFDQLEERADGNTNDTEMNDMNRDKAFQDELSLRYSFNKTDRIDIYGGTYIYKSDIRKSSTDGASSLGTGSDRRSQEYSAGIQIRKGLRKDGSSHIRIKAEYGKSKDKHSEAYTSAGDTEPALRRLNTDKLYISPYLYLNFNGKSSLTAGAEYQYLTDRHDYNGTATLPYVRDARFTSKGHDYGAWASYEILTGDLYFQAALNYHGTKSIHKDYMEAENNIDSWEDGIYPTLFGQWTMDNEKMVYLSFQYRHYYSLPNYNYRLPSVTWQNAGLYSTGNTDLTKENYDQAAISLSLSRKWLLSYHFYYGSNMVRVIMRQDEKRHGVYYTKPYNAGDWMCHRLRLTYSGRVTKFWHNRSNLSLEWQRETMPERKVCNPSVSFSSNNDFSLCKNFGVTLSLSASSKYKSLCYDSNASYCIDIGAYGSLLKDKLSLELMCGNLFFNRSKTTVHGDGWKITRRDLCPNTRIRLTATLSFSAGKKIKNVSLPKTNRMSRQTPTL